MSKLPKFVWVILVLGVIWLLFHLATSNPAYGGSNAYGTGGAVGEA